jgi:hypothetical protein
MVATQQQIDAILSAAQSLFMLLPISGLVAMAEGKPTLLKGPRAVIVVAATIAFSLLVVMFYISDNDLGVGLASTNLTLRVIEGVRVGQLHFRALAAAKTKEREHTFTAVTQKTPAGSDI